MNSSLIEKYNVPVPRYTSYPTVPYWEKEAPDTEQWIGSIHDSWHMVNKGKGISLYIHLPYCESLCTYCGCNTRITVNHKVEEPYIRAVLEEWAMYESAFPETAVIDEIHLGGGTPTFFSPENLRQLILGIQGSAIISNNAHLSFEAHPASTTKEHLQVLYDMGFRRLSLGIQDFDPHVQEVINRKQSEEQVIEVMDQARKIGYTSINFDLIYGLPFQTSHSIQNTVEKVIAMQPDRIAFYAYAHVPWMKPGQRRYSEADLPKEEEKLALYETGKKMLLNAGYLEVGMDHFALADDELIHADKRGELHRNFMGYTTTQSKILIGLGVSAISDSWFGFAQNHKVVEDYLKAIEERRLPINKGHILTPTDLVIRQHILNIMCRSSTSWEKEELQCKELYEGLNRMDEVINDGLVKVDPFHLKVPDKGKPFLRNICMALDARLHEKQPESRIFSSAI
ncbi:MAG: oxygen-independent coproporphyrinogen III oxidase [Flavobacteriales bacterium]